MELHCPSELTFEASPYGKKLPYIFLNSSTLKCPLGQSFRKPLYHSWISASRMKLIKWQQFSVMVNLKTQIRWDWPTCQFQFFRQKLNNSKKSIFKLPSLQQFTIKQINMDTLKFWKSIHIYNSLPENSVFCLRSSKTSGFNLLFCLPIFFFNYNLQM